MDPHTWPCKSGTTSTNIHSATMWGYGMLSGRPAWGDERSGKVAREGQGYPCYQHDMMMMMMMKCISSNKKLNIMESIFIDLVLRWKVYLSIYLFLSRCVSDELVKTEPRQLLLLGKKKKKVLHRISSEIFFFKSKCKIMNFHLTLNSIYDQLASAESVPSSGPFVRWNQLEIMCAKILSVIN